MERRRPAIARLRHLFTWSCRGAAKEYQADRIVAFLTQSHMHGIIRRNVVFEASTFVVQVVHHVCVHTLHSNMYSVIA